MGNGWLGGEKNSPAPAPPKRWRWYSELFDLIWLCVKCRFNWAVKGIFHGISVLNAKDRSRVHKIVSFYSIFSLLNPSHVYQMFKLIVSSHRQCINTSILTVQRAACGANFVRFMKGSPKSLTFTICRNILSKTCFRLCRRKLITQIFMSWF
jgi:hypothetical protein